MLLNSTEDEVEHLQIESKSFYYQLGTHQLKVTDALVCNLQNRAKKSKYFSELGKVLQVGIGKCQYLRL